MPLLSLSDGRAVLSQYRIPGLPILSSTQRGLHSVTEQIWMYGIMAVHEGHAYIGMVEGLPREISEVIHHTYECIGFSRTA